MTRAELIAGLRAEAEAASGKQKALGERLAEAQAEVRRLGQEAERARQHFSDLWCAVEALEKLGGRG